MTKQFEKLSEEEIDKLLVAPILVSIIAMGKDHELSETGKADAIKLAHLKTFTSDPLLKDYYLEVEKDFESKFDKIVNNYSPFDPVKREALKKEIDSINHIISKLGSEYARTLHSSLSGFADHVKKSEQSLWDDFVFPIPISGLTK